MKTLFTLILSLSLSLSALAQAPQMLSYQAAVRNNSGIAIPNKKLCVRISIHESSTSGKTDYQETFTPTSNNLGLFTLNIGTGTPVSGTFLDIDWSTGTKFLQVEIDTAGGINYTDMGTTQLLSVPYALYAAKAGNSLSAGNGIAIRNDSIVNVSPDRSITIKGTGTATVTGTYPDFTIHGDSSQNNSAQWNANEIQGQKISNATPTNKEVLKWNSVTNEWEPAVDSSVSYKAGNGLYLKGDTFNSAWTAKSTDIYNNNTGNVGIGKAPSYSLDVKGPANCDSLMLGGITIMKTTGYNNLFIGQNAGLKSGTGGANLFEGLDAGYSNTDGSYNTFIGLRAGYSNTIGNFNVLLGMNAGYANVYGNNNIMLGENAGSSNTLGNYNIFIGGDAGNNNVSGSSNVFVGLNAGSTNYIGYSNTAIGSMSGYSVVKGNRNTFLGDSADASKNNLNNATAIGFNAKVNSSYTMAFGGSEITAWVFGRSSVGSTSYALQVGSTS